MKISLSCSLVKSPRTCALLEQFTVMAESKSITYYAIYREGYAITTHSLPSRSSAQVNARLDALGAIAMRHQSELDAIMLAPDYEDFKRGVAAPIATDLYWKAMQVIEKEIMK